MYEHHTKPLLPRRVFLVRLARSVAMGLVCIVAALGVGMAGYHWFVKLSWIDAFENAAMILSGMGPVSPVDSDAGKLFAGCYALFSGLMFVATVGVIFAPVYHRFLHKFHLADDK
jgi:hypothetical protein